ncbi:InlB B-repeat-containing protein, partial [Carnobacterium maltaromaticum]|uniref:InlB B-repeat-containing protein n=1 Tax=Carnobacterium maltaromaticum TaxID=2751 RepID=UPI00295F2674
PAQNVAVGAPVMEPTPTPIRSGYTFTGWNSSITGSGIVWDFSTNVMPDNDLSLYAQWQINSHTVIFDLNGGTSAEYPPQSIVFGAILKEPNPAPTRQGYTFVGWYDETNNLWDFGKLTMPDMEFKLVAHWEKLSSNSIESDGGGISKTENKPSAENSIFPKTGEKSSLMTTLGLLLIGCLAIGLYPRKYKI